MKKLLFVLSFFAAVCAQAQGIKISALPPFVSANDSGYVPVAIGGVTYKVALSRIGVNDIFIRNDSLFKKKSGSSIFIGKVNSNVTQLDTTTVLNLIDSFANCSLETVAALQSFDRFGNDLAIVRDEKTGGLFQYSATGTDNGGTVYPELHGGHWKRVYSGLLNVLWFGAAGDGVTNEVTAINLAKAAGNSIYFPPATGYKINSTITFSNDMTIKGEFLSGPIICGITNGSDVFTFNAKANVNDIVINSDTRVNALGIHQVGARYNYNHVRVRNLSKGFFFASYIGTAQSCYVGGADSVGWKADLANNCDFNIQVESSTKGFEITNSSQLNLRACMVESAPSTTPNPVASSIDGSKVITGQLYFEGDNSDFAASHLAIGTGSKCFNVDLSISLATCSAQNYPITIDNVENCTINGYSSSSTSSRRVFKTTANTKGLSVKMFGSGSNGATFTDSAGVLSPKLNYFPNKNFDVWFNGWDQIITQKASFSQETTIVRNQKAVKVTAQAAVTGSAYLFISTGANYIEQLRGKTITLFAWVWVPNISEYSNQPVNVSTAPTAYINVKSSNGVTTVQGTAGTANYIKGDWNLMKSTVAVQSDATSIQCYFFPNGNSAYTQTGNEYIVLGNVYILNTDDDNVALNGTFTDAPAISSMYNGTSLRKTGGATAPNSTYMYFNIGDIVWDTTHANNTKIGNICLTSGSPGTWQSFGAVASTGLTNTNNTWTNDLSTGLFLDTAKSIGSTKSNGVYQIIGSDNGFTGKVVLGKRADIVIDENSSSLLVGGISMTGKDFANANYITKLQSNQATLVSGLTVGVSDADAYRASFLVDKTNLAWGLTMSRGGAAIPFKIWMPNVLDVLTIDGTTGAALFSGSLTAKSISTGAITDSSSVVNNGLFKMIAPPTTVGNSFKYLVNPSAITFPRINADNTVTALDAASFRTAIGAGTGTGAGTVNSGTINQLAYYGATGSTVSGLTAITATRALVSDANGLPVASTATTTQLQYLSSATGTTGTTSTNLVFSTSPTLTTPIFSGTAAGATLTLSTGLFGAASSTNNIYHRQDLATGIAFSSNAATTFTSNRNTYAFNENWAPTSGSGTLIMMNVIPIINQTGTASGSVRGIYYNPTLTGLLGTHIGIENTTGSNYFNSTSGNSSIGVASGAALSAKFSVVSTTEQTRTAYNSSNYFSTTVGSVGDVTLNAVGSGSAFTLSDPLTVNGNVTLGTAGNKLTITEGTNGRVGQTTLVAGTKTITITGLTTSSRAFPGFVSQGGTSTGVFQYTMVCTADTLTITAVTVTGSTVSTDTSVINYLVLN